jgi:RNA polymerase sigma-70 factor (ECF subfamily)
VQEVAKRKNISLVLEKVSARAFTHGVLYLRISTICFGRQMAVQNCREVGRPRNGSGAEAGAVTSSELGICAPEQSRTARTRQRIIELYDRLRPSLRAYLCCLGMSPDQGEDVIQETFLRLVRHRSEQGAEDNLRAWVFRVAHHLSMDVHRSQRRWSYSHDDESRPMIRERTDPGPSPEQQVLLEERMRRFENAFAQLTPKQRQCVLLRAEGFRYREIATTLGISVQRVGELMQRSIALLEAHT